MDSSIIHEDLIFFTEKVFTDYFQNRGYIAACYEICINSMNIIIIIIIIIIPIYLYSMQTKII